MNLHPQSKFKIYNMTICKYEPCWLEISVESLLLRWPLNPVGILLILVVCYFLKISVFFDVFNTSVNCIWKKDKQNKPRPYSEVILLTKYPRIYIIHCLKHLLWNSGFYPMNKNSIFTSYIIFTLWKYQKCYFHSGGRLCRQVIYCRV